MKILKICLIFLSFLALSGCELINFLLFEETPPEQTGMLTVLSRENLDNYYSYTPKEVTEANCRTNGEGDLFLIKYNNNNFDIKGSTTGYVTNASRAAEQNICLSNINDESTQFNRIDFRYSEDFLTPNINNNRSTEIISENINQNYSIGTRKSFYIIPKLDNQQVAKSVNAELKYTSKYSYIWHVTDSDYISSSSLVNLEYKEFKKLGDMFDKIYPIETNIFGEIDYSSNSNFIEPSEKVSILVYDINTDSHANQKSGTFGYFYPGDLYTSNPNSNKCNIFYIDDYFTYEGEKYIYSTLAHEFQHMLNFINKKIKNSNSNTTQTWYTEMLSLVAEEMLQKTIGIDDKESPKSRLKIFNRYYYKGFTNWQEGNEVYIYYANAYAFGAFLVRNFGGSKLIKEIVNNSYLNQESITQALRTLGYNEDFNSVCEKFAQTVIFTQNCNNNKFYSLNRKIEEQDFTFDAIDLTTDFYANTISNYLYYGPVIFSPLSTNGLTDIGANSFSVHYIGKDIKNTSLSFPTSNIKLELFECN